MSSLSSSYMSCLLLQCWEDKAGRKAMSKYNAKGLTALRTKLRKYNRDFESQITEYKEVRGSTIYNFG